ncbi:magnesium chelatase subunit D [uncultured Litoreibacter sp.]|uniref:magnesium chelatase subunit D n=1 Tax=uncultured Litoreibacter sp. TaxID=1392394 RepID=UPI0026281BC7|nr:magnesium chelatase subunit D [uncultured Litoreibacter sp.]
MTALRLLAIDPVGMGGVVLRARAGPARDAAMEVAQGIFPKMVRLHPSMSTEDLTGGIDLAATLNSGRLTYRNGLLGPDRACFVLPMAERAGPQMAGQLAAALDQGKDCAFICLDEGVDDGEGIPATLSDRIAMQVSLDGVQVSELPSAEIKTVPSPLPAVDFFDELPETLVALAVRLGIISLRAPMHALRVAKAHAAFSGRGVVDEDDVAIAVALVYAHRTTILPNADEPETESEVAEPDTTPKQEHLLDLPEELLLDAVKTALPANLLDQLSAGPAKTGTGSGSGKRRLGNRRGRPLPARNVRAKPGARVDLMATLRAAIPWQKLRKDAAPHRTGAIVKPGDLRAKRYQELSDRLLIFTVDASGSAALARLGEAKGAVELLLAEAYARRDHVALIGFRGTEADVLLPPTRSLVQTKRRLADLPGGGGTPTAAGLAAALTMAQTAARKGLTPTVVLLTDGRSNIALDGSSDRTKAGQDATDMARALVSQGIDALVIDTGNRPATALNELACVMDAPYIALPRADARKLSDAVTSSLDR